MYESLLDEVEADNREAGAQIDGMCRTIGEVSISNRHMIIFKICLDTRLFSHLTFHCVVCRVLGHNFKIKERLKSFV